MMLRDATTADIPALLALGAIMQAESPEFMADGWEPVKVGKVIEWLIGNEDGLALVAEKDGQVIGGVLAMVTEQFFSFTREACEFAVFVHPDHRGSTLGLRMLKRYQAWALERGAAKVKAGITTGVTLDATTRLYQAAGFRHTGHLLEFKGN